MKKILFTIAAIAMMFTFASCGGSSSSSSSSSEGDSEVAMQFLDCCSNNEVEKAKGYITEILDNFDSYSSEDKSAIIAGLAQLTATTKDPNIGGAFLTLYEACKDDSSVEMDKEAAYFAKWVENGFKNDTPTCSGSSNNDGGMSEDGASEDGNTNNANVQE